MNKIKLPNYTLKEEIINSISHGIGTILSIIGLILLIINSHNHKSIELISFIIYGTSLILLYLISCLYHGLAPNLKAKKILRVIDHNNVFLFEAGTFTPVCLLIIGGKVGLIYFCIIWFFSFLGIVLNSINVDKYQKLSLIFHLVIGWSIILMLKNISNSLNVIGITFLLLGGILYTIGAYLYKIGSKKKYMHCIFHFFCLAGSIVHFFMIYLFIK